MYFKFLIIIFVTCQVAIVTCTPSQYSICDGNYVNATSQIDFLISPGYPQQYPANVSCSTVIKAKEGSYIQIAIYDLQLIQTDFLEIFAGSSPIESQRVFHTQHYEGPPVSMKYFMIKSNSAFIHFASFGPWQSKGFQLAYKAFDLSCTKTVTAEATDVTIKSPGYPYRSMTESDCFTVINYPEDYVLNFTFTGCKLTQYSDAFEIYIQLSPFYFQRLVYTEYCLALPTYTMILPFKSILVSYSPLTNERGQGGYEATIKALEPFQCNELPLDVTFVVPLQMNNDDRNFVLDYYTKLALQGIIDSYWDNSGQGNVRFSLVAQNKQQILSFAPINLDTKFQSKQELLVALDNITYTNQTQYGRGSFYAVQKEILPKRRFGKADHWIVLIGFDGGYADLFREEMIEDLRVLDLSGSTIMTTTMDIYNIAKYKLIASKQNYAFLYQKDQDIFNSLLEMKKSVCNGATKKASYTCGAPVKDVTFVVAGHNGVTKADFDSYAKPAVKSLVNHLWNDNNNNNDVRFALVVFTSRFEDFIPFNYNTTFESKAQLLTGIDNIQYKQVAWYVLPGTFSTVTKNVAPITRQGNIPHLVIVVDYSGGYYHNSEVMSDARTVEQTGATVLVLSPDLNNTVKYQKISSRNDYTIMLKGKQDVSDAFKVLDKIFCDGGFPTDSPKQPTKTPKPHNNAPPPVTAKLQMMLIVFIGLVFLIH